MKQRTDSLEGAQLAYAIAMAEGEDMTLWFENNGKHRRPHAAHGTDWCQAGPIIERNRIDVVADEHTDEWHSVMCGEVVHIAMGYGPTPIIAALRCYVASKFGDYIDLPKELENLP